MKIVEPSYQILTEITGDELYFIDRFARTCYKSEVKHDEEAIKQFVKGLITRGHEAMLEHSILSVKFICDRGLSHEIVRHRMASFAQESTRYCNYSKDKFGHEITVVNPGFYGKGSEEMYYIWKDSCQEAERAYFELIDKYGATPEMARSVLPTSLKTEIIMTANYREWRHFFKLRAAEETGRSHYQMRELTSKLVKELKTQIPIIFDDIEVRYDWAK